MRRCNLLHLTRVPCWQAFAATTLLTLLACGGGSDAPGTPAAPAPPPTAPPPAPPPPTYSTSGLAYERSDTVAYPITPTPIAALGNVQLSLEATNASTGADGRYSFSTSLSTGNEYKLQHAQLAGYIPTWYPWISIEANEPKFLGLYREVPVTPRPGFAKGTVTLDAGGWLQTFYAAGLFTPTYARAAQMGSTIFVLPDQQFVTAMDTAAGTVTMLSGGVPGTRWGEDLVASLPNLVRQTHDMGKEFMIWWLPFVPPQLIPNGATTFFTVSRNNTAFWDAVFAAWRPFVLARAAIARDLGIDYIGLGLRGRSDIGPERFAALIRDIRALGYRGKIFYLATFNVGAFNELINTDPAFVALWDGFVLRSTRLVAAAPGETLQRAQTRARMRTSLRSELERLAYLPKPLWLSPAINSVHGGAIGLGGDVTPSNRAQFERDYAQQADAFMAVAEVINATPTGNGRIMGLLPWGYHFKDNFWDGFARNDAAMDMGQSIRGKPAEAVVKWWYERW